MARDAMDRQRLRDMNMLDQVRIGYEQKQAYQDWLAELASEGYLTPEEYSARMDWLFAARTEDEVKAAFRDLPRLKPKGMEPANPAKRVTSKRKFRDTPKYSVMWMGYGAVLAVFSAIDGNLFSLIVDLVLIAIWAVVLVFRIRDE